MAHNEEIILLTILKLQGGDPNKLRLEFHHA